MSLKEQLTNDMKKAMKAKQVERLSTIRQLRSAIKNKEIDLGKELEDDAVISVIGTLVKQRREAAQMYRDNDRLELAEKEEAELVVLQGYLPAQLGEAEVREIVSAVIAEVGATSPKDMGKVMPQVMARTKGAADGKLVNQLVREQLSGSTPWSLLLSFIDIGILGILGVFLLKGVIRGLLKEVCSLLGLVLGCVFAFTFHLPLAQFFQDSFALPPQLCVWGSFVAIFLLVVIIFGVLGYVLHRFVRLVFLGGFNRLAGALFGLVQGVVLLSMIVLALNSSVVPKSARTMLRDSQLAPPFANLGQAMFTGSRNLIGR